MRRQQVGTTSSSIQRDGNESGKQARTHCQKGRQIGGTEPYPGPQKLRAPLDGNDVEQLNQNDHGLFIPDLGIGAMPAAQWGGRTVPAENGAGQAGQRSRQRHGEVVAGKRLLQVIDGVAVDKDRLQAMFDIIVGKAGQPAKKCGDAGTGGCRCKKAGLQDRAEAR